MFAATRYQVFISSTYRDLKEERKQVMNVLLRLDCIPCGMELFSAADDSQWNIIKRLIDDCDYYLLILGGRYGSLAEDGVGYTEKEYDYAKKSGKPMISFYHENRANLFIEQTVPTAEEQCRLDKFYEKVKEPRMCASWTSADNLALEVFAGLSQLKTDRPAIGWVRSNQIPSFLLQIPPLTDPLSNTTWNFLGVNRQTINHFVFKNTGEVTCAHTYDQAIWRRIDDETILFGYGTESSYIVFKPELSDSTTMVGQHSSGRKRYLRKVK